MDLFARFDANKLRIKLKLAATRIEQQKNKRTLEIVKQKRAVAEMLAGGKDEELARIRTEHIVVDDWQVEVLGIIGLLCNLLQERTRLLEASETVPFDMQESCCTLIYAATRIDIPELMDIKRQLLLKFKGLTKLMDTEEKCKEVVNERVLVKLSVKPPNAYTVTSYMKHIAEEHNVDWAPDESVGAQAMRFDAPMIAPVGSTVVAGGASGIQAPYMVTDGTIASKPKPGLVVASQQVKGADGEYRVLAGQPATGPPARVLPPPVPALPGAVHPPQPAVAGDPSVPDFDELSRRFEALKKR